MTVSPGRTLLHYRLADKIGEGGMGQVWRATDTTLGREVAIKILPPEVAADPDRIARFEREAHVLAALNHYGIAAIHGLHEADGVRFLAMELVPGEDLATRMAAGALEPAEALAIARQIAEALETAHEQGIVHRDLKPANVKLTPGGKVKLLDFGLAKALDPLASGSGTATPLTHSPTLTLGATLRGTILGTAAYMSPEQAAGATVDRRADIWAFGVVLYEMLAGRRLFDGETTSHMLASVLKDDPDFGALPPETPAAVLRLLRRCLRKKARERLQAIGDARIVLDEVLAGTSDEAAARPEAEAHARTPRLWAVLGVGVAALAIGAFAASLWLPRSSAMVTPRTVSELGLPDGMRAHSVALSPDGSRLAFVARGGAESVWRIWVRGLASRELRAIPGTDSAAMPFWSPDSRSLGFVADRQIKRVDLDGGTPVRLTAVEQPCGATWARDAIVYCLGWNQRGLMRIPPSGGEPTQATQAAEGQVHWAPSFVDGGPAFLYVSEPITGRLTDRRLRMAQLDGGDDRELMPTQSGALYSDGALYYLRDTTLLARPFDPTTAAPGPGDAELVAEGVNLFRSAVFTVARGLLVFVAQGEEQGSRITMYARDGKLRETIDSETFLDDVNVSRDGRRVAVMKASPLSPSGSDTSDVWTFELDRKIFSRATFGESDDDPVFSPDATRLAFAHEGDLYVRASNGSGEPVRIVDSNDDIVTSDWTADGWILYTDIVAGADDMFAVPEQGGEPRRLSATPFREMTPQVSPDGRWLAYTSDEGGDPQVYLSRWPGLDGKSRVSKETAAMPRWSADGRTLYFLTNDRRILRATIGAGAGEPHLGLPEEVVRTNYEGSYTTRSNRWAVLPDDSGFLVLEAPEGQASRSTSLVLVTQPRSRGERAR